MVREGLCRERVCVYFSTWVHMYVLTDSDCDQLRSHPIQAQWSRECVSVCYRPQIT